MENFLQLIASLQAVVAKMEAQSADFPAQLEQVRAEALEEGKRSRDQEIADLITQKDAEKAEFGASEFKRGVASVECPVSDKIYTQEELDKAIADATGPLNEQVTAMQGQIAELKTQLDGVDQKVSDAVSAAVTQLKAEIVADFEATQVDDAAFLAKWKA